MMFKEQTALVTGGSRGIGRAVALRFAREGANIVVCALTEARLRVVVSELRSFGAQALGVVADVRSEQQIDACVQRTIDTFGRIDILVNNAGVSKPAPLVETELTAWNLILETNATGTFLFTRAVLPHMLRQAEGLILNVSSRSGQQGFPRYAAYCASKFAVMGFTLSVAEEVGRYGVRVNVICPGEVDTDMNRASHPGIEDTSDWLQPEAVADVAAFLASPQGAGIHGAAVNVYGLSRKPSHGGGRA